MKRLIICIIFFLIVFSGCQNKFSDTPTPISKETSESIEELDKTIEKIETNLNALDEFIQASDDLSQFALKYDRLIKQKKEIEATNLLMNFSSKFKSTYKKK